MNNQNIIQVMITQLARLPGLGPRSSRRIVLHLLQNRQKLLLPLLETFIRFTDEARDCSLCGNVTTNNLCKVCRSESRKTEIICIVETVADLWAIERSAVYSGRYFVLGGTLSILDEYKPDDLRIPLLIDRVHKEDIDEIILALNATVGGQTTAHYIAEQLRNFKVKITTLGRGMPVGGELDYLDGGTITAAILGRQGY